MKTIVSKRTATRIGMLGVLGATLFGVTTSTAMASATAGNTATTASTATTGRDVDVKYTRGFNLTNLSGHTLKVLSVLGADHEEDRYPRDGTLVAPGQSVGYEVAWAWPYTHNLNSTFAVQADDGRQIGTLKSTMSVITHTVSTEQKSWGSSTVGVLNTGGQQLTFLDAGGSTIDVPATDRVAQSRALNNLCTNTAARCSFVPQKQEAVMGPTHPVGHAVANNTELEQGTMISIEDMVGTSENVEISASVQASIMKIVEVSVTATYGKSWTQSHTFTQAQWIQISPYHKSWMTASEPMIRTIGDFTITIGNTTWTLRGIAIDSPDPDKKRQGVFHIESTPLTPTEQAALPAALHTATVGDAAN